MMAISITVIFAPVVALVAVVDQYRTNVTVGSPIGLLLAITHS